MENLVGRKVRCIQEHESIPMTKWQSYVIVEDDGILIRFRINKEERMFGICNHKDLKEKEFFELLPDEPQFKQGDKVLYTDDLVNWEEGIFLVKHDESYIVESDEMLLYAIEIKPHEDEIKLGDWVKNNKGGYVFKYDNESDSKINLTKITDEVLINKLNEL